MKSYYYLIKDDCRKGLVKYLEKALLKISKNDNSLILDIGCGTGVPAIWIAENFPWTLIAVDRDRDAINYLQKKLKNKNLQSKVEVLNKSFFDFKPEKESFDIILAEGFLNVIGFENGFTKIIEILKKQGYFIIHDEYRDHGIKVEFIQKNNCKIIDLFYLDEEIWWKDYYRQLESVINNLKDAKMKDLFSTDIKEIEHFKSNPSDFRSIYYTVLKL